MISEFVLTTILSLFGLLGVFLLCLVVFMIYAAIRYPEEVRDGVNYFIGCFVATMFGLFLIGISAKALGY